MKLVEVRDFSLKYASVDEYILKNISFAVEEGEVVAILGPSGSGKTTLLKKIANLFESSEVFESGTVVNKAAKETAMVFQDPRLLPWMNVLKNTLFGLEAIGGSDKDTFKKAMEALELVGLSDVVKYLPEHLSIGMQQRVNFARALACSPRLMLLDEPFSALDVDTKEGLRQEFLDIIKRKKMTAIFVTHDVDEAFYLADKMIVFSKKPTTIEGIYKKENFKKASLGMAGELDAFNG